MRSKDARDEKKVPKGLMEGRDGIRFAIMFAAALCLAAVVFGGGFFFPGTPDEAEKEPAQVYDKVPIPDVDKELVAKAKDTTPDQRLQRENEIYEHLLVKALEIAPGSLRALGMRELGYSVNAIRENPDRYRGKPVCFEGEIERLYEDPFKIPGLPNARTRGLLRTDAGDPVLFAVVGKVRNELTKGTYARVEGFFYKLRDEHLPNRIVKAPLVIGKHLRPAFRKWEPVHELDPETMGMVRDAGPSDAAQIEEIPLYHLISYVMHRPKEDGWKANYPNIERDSAKAMLDATGAVERGKPFRLLASLYKTRTVAAEANPLGVDFWTYAWIDHQDAGTIQIQIPGRLDGEWNINDYVVVYGHFFKRIYYETFPKNGVRNFKMVPFFVADSMYKWELLENEEDLIFRIVLAGVTLVLILAMTVLVIRDSRHDRRLREALVERRRKRRIKRSGS